MFVPVIDETTCINHKGCQRCYKVCPGAGIEINKIASDEFESDTIKKDKYIGYYEDCYSGYSLDEEIRFRSSSGGLVTQFLIYLLEKQYIAGAVVTRFNKNNEFLVDTFIARSKKELISARGSKYSPVSFHNVISMVKNEEKGKIAIVGLPCHIEGLRKYELLDAKFKDHVFAYFALYCSSGRNFYLTEYVFNQYKISKSGLDYFAYRDEGCLGSLIAKGFNRTTLKHFSVKQSFHQYYHPLRSFFIPKRCKLCIDHFGELADVSFGDLYIPPFSEDKVGISSVVVRKKYLNYILFQSKKHGFINIKKLEVTTLLESQIMAKRKKSVNIDMLRLEKMRGRRIPRYDIEIKRKLSIKSIVIYLHTLLQLFIGKRKALWPLISLFKDNRYKENK